MLILQNSLQLASIWLPGFSNEINATCYSIVNQNIVKSEVKFNINDAFMSDYNYNKLRLSLKVNSI